MGKSTHLEAQTVDKSTHLEAHAVGKSTKEAHTTVGKTSHLEAHKTYFVALHTYNLILNTVPGAGSSPWAAPFSPVYTQ